MALFAIEGDEIIVETIYPEVTIHTWATIKEYPTYREGIPFKYMIFDRLTHEKKVINV